MRENKFIHEYYMCRGCLNHRLNRVKDSNSISIKDCRMPSTLIESVSCSDPSKWEAIDVYAKIYEKKAKAYEDKVKDLQTYVSSFKVIENNRPSADNLISCNGVKRLYVYSWENSELENIENILAPADPLNVGYIVFYGWYEHNTGEIEKKKIYYRKDYEYFHSNRYFLACEADGSITKRTAKYIVDSEYSACNMERSDALFCLPYEDDMAAIKHFTTHTQTMLETAKRNAEQLRAKALNLRGEDGLLLGENDITLIRHGLSNKFFNLYMSCISELSIYCPQLITESLETRLNSFENFFCDNNHLGYFIYKKDHFSGFLMGKKSVSEDDKWKELTIEKIYILPTFRKKGIATESLQLLKSRSESISCSIFDEDKQSLHLFSNALGEPKYDKSRHFFIHDSIGKHYSWINKRTLKKEDIR